MRRLSGILLATVTLLSVAVPASADYGSGAAGGPVGTPVLSTVPYTAISDVMIVGDSITVRGYKDLAAALPGKRLAVNARGGRNTRLSVDAVLAMPHVPPVLIMAVGSNDVPDPTVMPTQIARLRAGVPDSVKVYWVDVQVSRTRYSTATQLADQRNSMWVNAAIWRGCTGSCTVISWAGFLAAKPFYRLPTYLQDGVHPYIGEGTRTWAAVIVGGMK